MTMALLTHQAPCPSGGCRHAVVSRCGHVVTTTGRPCVDCWAARSRANRKGKA